MWLKHLDPQKNNSKTWLRTGKRPWWFIVSPEPCRFQMKKPSIKTQYQFLLEPKGCQLVIVWWETPLGSPLRLFISSILKNAWHMIVLIWVHYFDTWKTTLFSGCQIFKDQHECMISNINEKKNTIYRKIHYRSRVKKVTDWRTIDDHECTDSAVRWEFTRFRYKRSKIKCG